MRKTPRASTSMELMSRYLDPTNDYAFKKLFSQQDRLISFLNAILELKSGHKIRQIQLLPKDQAPLIKDAKSTILDVKCTDEEGKQYIVEMQNRNYPSFIKRIQLYASHSYVSQISSGEQYNVLKPVILLCIANRVLFPSKNTCISYHDTLDRHTEEHDLEDISYVFIELPKFNKEEKDLVTLQDQWFYFFKNWENSGEIPSTIQEKEIIDAYHSMEQFNWSKGELEAYFEAQIALADDFLARQAEREEGKAEGLVEGEAKAVLEMAKKMLKRGLSLADVIEDTGLSSQEITRLQENLH